MRHMPSGPIWRDPSATLGLRHLREQLPTTSSQFGCSIPVKALMIGDDVRYAPLPDGTLWVRELDPATCLVLGSPPDETVKFVESLELETRSAGEQSLG